MCIPNIAVAVVFVGHVAQAPLGRHVDKEKRVVISFALRCFLYVIADCFASSEGVLNPLMVYSLLYSDCVTSAHASMVFDVCLSFIHSNIVIALFRFFCVLCSLTSYLIFSTLFFETVFALAALFS